MKFVEVKEVTDYVAKKSVKGTPYVRLELRCVSKSEADANDPENLYSFLIYFSEKGVKWALSNLKHLGFVGESLSVLEESGDPSQYFNKNYLEQNPLQAVAEASVVTGDDGQERTYWNVTKLKTKDQQGEKGVLGKFEGDFVKSRQNLERVLGKVSQAPELNNTNDLPKDAPDPF